MKRQSLKEQKRLEIIRTACRLFSEKGYYNTTMPDIAQAVGMSVGNLYNYFESKEELAKEIMMTVSDWVGERLRRVNEAEVSFREKLELLVRSFFEIALEEPELINYFLRVFLVNREVFSGGCEGFACVASVITEIMVFLSDGVERGELRNQSFYPAFTTIMGPLGGMVFLHTEGLLNRPLMDYVDEVSENLWRALKA
ncbi:MAG: TetR/AcrR family transcriptional regulator [Aquificaceae bacterium]|jgi:AcrR family transcriptional regulator|uniref:TetR/AcrR family transcriptional regulator n=1 Tax=Hydrogenobacter sp. Uz 6-8 TaxID=3384828 RepID=UPI000F1A42E3|nr:MAG: TetR/AcrR family transcriptional regulator [Aquificota bacterium]